MTTQGPEEGKRVGTKPSKGSQKEKENNSPALEDKISQEKPGTPQKQERPKREKKEKEVGTGLVKSVLSGDRLLIYVDAPKHAGPWQAPEEKEIKLSNLKAPLAASKGKQAQREEEVFATFFSFLCMEVSHLSCDRIGVGRARTSSVDWQLASVLNTRLIMCQQHRKEEESMVQCAREKSKQNLTCLCSRYRQIVCRKRKEGGSSRSFSRSGCCRLGQGFFAWREGRL